MPDYTKPISASNPPESRGNREARKKLEEKQNRDLETTIRGQEQTVTENKGARKEAAPIWNESNEAAPTVMPSTTGKTTARKTTKTTK